MRGLSSDLSYPLTKENWCPIKKLSKCCLSYFTSNPYKFASAWLYSQTANTPAIVVVVLTGVM